MRLWHTVWDKYGDVISINNGWVTVRFDGDKGVNGYELDAPYIKLIGQKMRYKNVEFRQAVDHASSDRPAEIVGWMDNNGKESCYTLCWLKEGKEEFYIETIGSRLTEYEDIDALMHVAKYALRILNTEKEFKEVL